MKGNKLVILAVVLVIFILADCLFVLTAQVAQLHNANKKVSVMRKKLSKFEQDLKARPGLLKDKERFQNQLRDTQTRFLSKDDSSFLISEINRVAKEIGLRLNTISPQGLKDIGGKKQDDFYYIPISLTFATGYHSLGRFINRLEKLEFSLRFEDVKLSGNYPDMKVSMVVCGVVKK